MTAMLRRVPEASALPGINALVEGFGGTPGAPMGGDIGSMEELRYLSSPHSNTGACHLYH